MINGPRWPPVVDAVDVQWDEPGSLLTSIMIESRCPEYGPDAGTHGTLLEHLHGEMQFNGLTYFLLAGRWYRVDADYVQFVTEDLVMLLGQIDFDASELELPPWDGALSEAEYNVRAATAADGINGDRVLTDNVELFDTLINKGDRTYIVHLKRGFDVKVRDVRSQIVNSANIIENDLRSADPARLKAHHAALKRHGRTSIPEGDFVDLFRKNRTYVLAYGTSTKVTRDSVEKFESVVARMETVTLGGQFRQIASADQLTRLAMTWVELVD